ncbi:MAG: YceD family protein [Burkholderiales bacterium]|nr:YceD family protein [Burkholderiales bacterium]
MMYIDNVKFAKNKQETHGEIDISKVERIQEIDAYSGFIKYSINGDVDKSNRPILVLNVCGKITTLCQSCLDPVEINLDSSTVVTIFFNEDKLDAALFSDENSDVEDAVLAEEEFDVMNLVEDEIIICLPYTSKHDDCDGLEYHDDVKSPFGILKDII